MIKLMYLSANIRYSETLLYFALSFCLVPVVGGEQELGTGKMIRRFWSNSQFLCHVTSVTTSIIIVLLVLVCGESW